MDQHEHDDDIAFWARFKFIQDTAMAALSPDDLAERVEFCRRTGEHGVRVEEVDETGVNIRLVWGGKPLATVPRRVFSDEAMLSGLDFTTVTDTPPDDLSPRDVT